MHLDALAVLPLGDGSLKKSSEVETSERIWRHDEGKANTTFWCSGHAM